MYAFGNNRSSIKTFCIMIIQVIFKSNKFILKADFELYWSMDFTQEIVGIALGDFDYDGRVDMMITTKGPLTTELDNNVVSFYI